MEDDEVSQRCGSGSRTNLQKIEVHLSLGVGFGFWFEF